MNKPVLSPASKAGQIIGEIFEQVVVELIDSYLVEKYPEYQILQPEEGKSLIKLEMLGGLSRQMDNVITLKDSNQPIALLETKWLKDARHHNDKGAWILQLREVKKKYPTVRGATAILLGYWTSGVGLMLMNEGGVQMVLVATDEQVYQTLQQPLDDFLGEETFILDAVQMRQRYIRPSDLLGLLEHLKNSGQLRPIAQTWLQFQSEDVTGMDRIKYAIDEFLLPISSSPKIQKFEISLQIETGNTIYAEFDDYEALQEFLEKYYANPQEILKTITPRKRDDDDPNSA